MDEVPVEAGSDSRAEIDRCTACGGMFLEFFDGEPGAIARGLESRGDVVRAGTRPSEGDGLMCPDCEQPMVLRAYLDQGPELPRCEGCLALFLTPETREQMARLELAPAEEHREPGWLEQLIDWVRA
jgi:hypothetical protein